MGLAYIESLERRLQFSAAIKYGVDASGDPDQTGVLNDTGPGLKDIGAQGVRLFTDVSFLSSDFDVTPGGQIYVRNPSLVTSLAYAKKYHDAGIDVTLCIQLATDRSMTDGSLLIDKKTGKSRQLTPTELRSPKVFGAWYDTLSKAQISKTDSTRVTKVIDFWEIGNEPNHVSGSYWPDDRSQPDGGIEQQIDSYVDHDLVPAYDVLSKIHEPVIGAGLASGTAAQYNELNNQAGARFHQYSDHVDYLNFHPYGYLNAADSTLTPQADVTNFTSTIYGDGTVTKPFVMTEYNVVNYGHAFPLDPDPSPSDAAQQLAIANDLDAAHTALLANAQVKKHCAWIYYYRLIATDKSQNGAVFYPPPSGTGVYVPLTAIYDLFRKWANGDSSATPKTSAGVVNLGDQPVTNAIVIQKDGKTLVLSDDGVRRYDTDGKLDSTYGVSGFAKLSLIGQILALQSDGNLIVAGNVDDTSASDTPYHLVVTRLSTSGKVDKSFGTSGIFALGAGSGTTARSIALRAGKIVVAGANAGVSDGVVVRLEVAGQLDATFGDDGVAMVAGDGQFTDVEIAKSGAVTVLANVYALSPEASIVRFTSAGALDKKFSKDGISAPQAVTGDGMFVNTTGSVILLGHAPLAQTEVLSSYTPSGNLDTSFGDKGIESLPGTKFIRANAIELPDGSRYLFGSIAPSLTSDSARIYLAKLTAADQIDASFGSKGVMTLSSPNVQDLPLADALDSDGALTLAAATFTQHDEGGMTQELFEVSDLT